MTREDEQPPGQEDTNRIRADAEFRNLLEPLSGGHEHPDIRLARAVWSRIAEPGDAIAGETIDRLGAVESLNLLASKSNARVVERALYEARPDDPRVSSRQLTAALQRWRPRLDRAATVADLRQAANHNMRLLIPEDSDWPEALNDLGAHTPHVLWVRGDPAHLRRASLAVVGARACSGYGSHITAELTNEACSAEFAIVSGAAYGVDAVAHRTALAVNAPTIAVLAGGADRPYPASHDQLITQIVRHGAVCSELVPGSAPTRWRFLQRNRLISALSRAILVTEAGVRSGTLNTAGHGAEMGRPLGAVPGPVTSATSAGCHRLIRDYGAALITNGSDVRELIGAEHDPVLFGSDNPTLNDGAAPRVPSLHLRIIDSLPLRGGRILIEIAKIAGVTPQEARETLAELELLQYVQQRETTTGGEVLWTLQKRA
ncbi:MAG: DNA-processing protein DprA [Leucobacter sp.]